MPEIAEFRMNGARRRVDTERGRTLCRGLREDLDRTGAKCGYG